MVPLKQTGQPPGDELFEDDVAGRCGRSPSEIWLGRQLLIECLDSASHDSAIEKSLGPALSRLPHPISKGWPLRQIDDGRGQSLGGARTDQDAVLPRSNDLGWPVVAAERDYRQAGCHAFDDRPTEGLGKGRVDEDVRSGEDGSCVRNVSAQLDDTARDSRVDPAAESVLQVALISKPVVAAQAESGRLPGSHHEPGGFHQ